MAESVDASLGHLLRDLAPQVLGAVARRHADFAAAEDAVQEALIAASRQWPVDGMPDNPRGWLYHTAMRRLTDHVRSEMARRRREDVVATERSAIETVVPALFGEIDANEDDTLVLLFMCCHPALTPPSAIALTLRAVGGLTTAEIANAFLVPEATMAQRISRAKQSIKSSNIPFRMPNDDERAERLAAVLHVLYLIFNEGYASSVGDALQRSDLANEAIRLTRAVRALLPRDGEVGGLLALMLLTDARRAARTGSSGEIDSARRAGSIALGSAAHRRGDRADLGDVVEGIRGSVSDAGGDRGGSRRSSYGGGHGLERDSRAVRRAEANHATIRWWC